MPLPTREDIDNFLASLGDVADAHAMQLEIDTLRARVLDLETILERVNMLTCPPNTPPNSVSSSSIFQTAKPTGTLSLPTEQS